MCDNEQDLIEKILRDDNLSREEKEKAFRQVLSRPKRQVKRRSRWVSWGQEGDATLKYFSQNPKVCQAFRGVIGLSVSFLETVKRVAALAQSNLPICLCGPRGIGKESYARAVHELSKRQGKFITLNCGLENDPNTQRSELFGPVKGAFTGATGKREGRFKIADNGTLFLDELGRLAPDLQAQLNRSIEPGTGEIQTMPLGQDIRTQLTFG